ncbi:twin-arginine translocase subunit TatC [bacterium]|nr:twin-arginine translocase subunit TatC [bacterium]
MEDQELGNDSLIGHLSELRSCLIYSFIYIFIGFLICWGFSEQILEFIRKPIAPFLSNSGGGLVFTAPMDKFLAHIKVSLLSSIIISCPFWMHQLWRFISPAMYKEEKKSAAFFIFFSSLMFLVGISFVYFLVYPMAFDFLMNFGGGVDKPMLTIKEYLSFFITTTLVFGLAFEMPIIFAVLAKMGLVKKEFLKKNRRYAIVILAAMSAFLTPPDIISMGMMMVPLILLYEMSIILTGIMAPKETNEAH